MNIDISIPGQETNKVRTIYLVLGALGLAYFILSIVFPEFIVVHYYLWILILPGIIESLLFGLGRKRVFGDSFPYLKINEERIEKSKGGLFAKPEVIYWADTKAIELKLFEIHLTTTDDKHITIDLTNLTDDNLKIVKDYILTVKKNREHQ